MKEPNAYTKETVEALEQVRGPVRVTFQEVQASDGTYVSGWDQPFGNEQRYSDLAAACFLPAEIAKDPSIESPAP